MKLRSILAIVVGYLTWVFAFWTPIILLTFVWPALRETGPAFMQDRRYDIFDTSMLVAFQFVWPFANGAAGFVVRLISRRQLEVWVFAALIFAYFAYNHWWALWGQMPDWYNLVVVVPVVPAVWLGSWIAQRLGARPSAG